MTPRHVAGAGTWWRTDAWKTATAAAEAEDHGDETHVAVPTTAEYIYKWINFFMLAGILYWLLVVPPAFVKENFEFEGLQVILAARNKSIIASRDLAKEQTAQASEGLDSVGGSTRARRGGGSRISLPRRARPPSMTRRR